MTIKRIFQSLNNSPALTIIFILMTVILTVVSFFCAVIFQINVQAEKYQYSHYLATMSLYSEDENYPESLINSLLSIPHVTNYGTIIFNDKAIPLNFRNYVGECNNEENEVKVISNLNFSAEQEFATGQAVVVQGSIPDNNEAGIVIDEELARYNNISLNDEVQFKINGTAISAKVVCIYRLLFPIQETVSYGYRSEYVDTDFSYIFITTAALTEYDFSTSEYCGLYFYVDNYNNIKDTIAEARKIIPDNYTINDSTEEISAAVFIATQKSETIYKIMIYLLIIFAFVINFLMIIYVYRNYKSDAYILFILGWSKKRIAFDFMLNILVETIPAIIICTATDVIFYRSISSYWIYSIYYDPNYYLTYQQLENYFSDINISYFALILPSLLVVTFQCALSLCIYLISEKKDTDHQL
jgi:ABC-type lipoprotein release transport system permease subunit